MITQPYYVARCSAVIQINDTFSLCQHILVQLGCEFVDGDNWHPAANVEKMSGGIPLTDEVWLE